MSEPPTQSDASTVARSPGRDVVLFSTADWRHPTWTNKQHVARHLAERGFRVLYVDSLGLRRPTLARRDVGRIVGRLRKAARPLERVRENLWIHSPVVLPFHRSAVTRRLNRRWLAMVIRGLIRRLGFDRPLLLTYNPLVVDLVDDIPHGPLIYHCVDDLAAAPGLPHEAIRAAEPALVARCDAVFATSRSLEQRCRQWAADSVHYFPNVADFGHFARARDAGLEPADLAAVPHPRIGFVGAISDYKVDQELVSAVARARPDWHWVMIGRVGEGQPGSDASVLRLPNVHLLGVKDYAELPDYHRGFDVAALPCRLNDYTRSMFPMKFFEYLASGVPVVAAPLPALAEFADAFATADTPEAFTAAVERILSGTRPDAAMCERLAREHTWDRRLDFMLDVIAKCEQG